LIEARDPDGAFVDPTPLLADVARSEFAPALDNLLDALQRATGHALEDDLALLLVCYDPD
jgi:hypothetical protein